jgi:23S rRNA pseudouridine1911/1915/1917 synthase
VPLPPVLVEDEAILAFAKPSGLPVAPEGGNGLPESLLAMVQTRWGRGVTTVHRLDTEASGVVLFARTKEALDFLTGQFQSKSAEKVYQAIVVLIAPEDPTAGAGHVSPVGGASPAEFLVSLTMGPDPEMPGRMRVCRGRGGKSSETHIRMLGRFGKFAHVECRPRTGRNHQVRLHLASAGMPVLNDALYGHPECRLLLSDLKRHYKGRGRERPMVERLALHASALEIVHPVTRDRIRIEVELPRDFEIALKNLKRYASGSPRASRRGG